MNCDQARLENLLPTGGEGGSAEGAALHLANCPKCRERLRVMVCLAALKRSPRRPALKVRRLRWAALAAAVLGLILMVASPPNPEPQTALSTRKAYPRFPLRTRSRSVDPSARELGLQAYQAGDFEEAVKRLEGFPLDPEASFFLGVSLYLSGRPDQALRRLEVARKQARWRRPALWYRANALLALDRIVEAREILESLAEGEGEFCPEAGELLKRPELRPSRPKEPR